MNSQPNRDSYMKIDYFFGFQLFRRFFTSRELKDPRAANSSTPFWNKSPPTCDGDATMLVLDMIFLNSRGLILTCFLGSSQTSTIQKANHKIENVPVK